jgi:ABC-type lipoprotein release transport system permease subunit
MTSDLASLAGRVLLVRRGRNVAGIALVLGLTAGLSMFALAGARRTQSAYSRFLRSVNPSTMSVSTSRSYDAAHNAALAALPYVVASRTYVGFNVFALRDGRPDFTQDFEATGTFDGRYFDQDRFTATSGRAADPRRVDEVVVNELAAERYGYHVGQALDLGGYPADQIEAPTFITDYVSATIVGIGLFPDEVLQDEADRTTRLLLTPAFCNAVPEFATYDLQGLVLRPGNANVDAVRREVAKITPPGVSVFRLTSVDQFHAVQAMRPLSIALGVFGAIAAVAALVVAAQALVRLVQVDEQWRSTLRALGARPREIVAISMIAPGIAIFAGTALAVALATVASPLMPIGPMRKVEVARGFDADLTVLGIGAVAVVVTLVATTVTLLMWRAPQRLGRRGGTVPAASRVVAAASAAGLSPTVVTGLRLVLERDSSGTTHVRSVMIGATTAIAALVSALTFGASLHTLVGTPRLFGWSWDATVLAANGYGNIPLDRARSILADDENVAGWSGAYFGEQSIDGHDVPLLGMDADAGVAPPMLDGRPIDGPREIVLGAETAAELDKHVGDTLTLGNGPANVVTVVGIATLPTVGIAHGVRTSLGVGAIVSHELVPGYDYDLTGVYTGDLGPRALFIRFRPGTNTKEELAHLRETTALLTVNGGLTVLPVQRPAEIVNSASIGSAPVFLATALALGAVASLTIALASSAQRCRRDLAVLKALGFTQRQLAATISWHATIIAVAGVVVGIPSGIVVGRVMWSLFARELNVVVQPTSPALIFAGLALAAILIANAAAIVPSRASRRIDAASLLRAD